MGYIPAKERLRRDLARRLIGVKQREQAERAHIGEEHQRQEGRAGRAARSFPPRRSFLQSPCQQVG